LEGVDRPLPGVSIRARTGASRSITLSPSGLEPAQTWRFVSDDQGEDRSALKALESRLAAARKRNTVEENDVIEDRSLAGAGMALGFRILVELLACIAVGTGIGYALDLWLGTLPWMMLGFFVLGSVAGMVTVARTAQEFERRRQRDDAGGTQR
jgi:ATP synthase protein I